MGAAPPPSSPGRSLPSRRWWALAMAAILLAVILVIAGEVYFPIHRTGRSTLGAGHWIGPDPDNASFLDDRTSADTLAVNLSGGPFQLVGGMAITSDRATTLPLDESGAFSCPLIPQPYASLAAIRMPSVAGVTGGGLAPVWTFDYLGPGGNGVRIAVTDGRAVALGTIMFSSAACPGDERPTVNVTSPYDSSSIGLQALNLGGATFLEENANAEVTYSLAPGLEPGLHGVLAEEWNVTFDACGGAVSGSPLATTLGSALTYRFDAQTGILQTTDSRTYDCPQGANGPIPYPLPEDLTVNAPVMEILGSHVVYNATIALACCGLTYGNLSVVLQLPGNTPVPAGAVLSILNATGATMCELSGAELTGAPVDCGTPVFTGDLLSLSLPASGNGSASLALDGRWDFTGEVDVPLSEAIPLDPAYA